MMVASAIKYTTYFLIGSLLTGFFIRESRMELVCHKWRQVGIKPFKDKFRQVNTHEKVITLARNGDYNEVLYGQLRMKGRWKFSTDSTKLAFELTDFNGAKINNTLPLDKIRPTDSLIRLTKDTLIYGRVGYYGPGKVYGHDDLYFVRED